MFLGLLGIFNLLIHPPYITPAAGCYHLTRNNQRIIAEYFLNIIRVTLVIGRTEAFDILHDNHLLFLFYHTSTTLHTFSRMRIQRQAEISYVTSSVKFYDSLLIGSHTEIFSLRRNNQWNMAHHHGAVLEYPATFHHFFIVAIKWSNCPQTQQRLKREIVHRESFSRQDGLSLLRTVDFS